MLIQDIWSPSKYKLSNIEISFSPPYLHRLNLSKSSNSQDWILLGQNIHAITANTINHPTFYLLSFITICSLKKHHSTSYPSSHTPILYQNQARHAFFTSFIIEPNQNIGEIEVMIRSVSSFDQKEMRGELLVIIWRKIVVAIRPSQND